MVETVIEGVRRRLDPDASDILRRIREAGIPPWHTLPVAEARAVYRRRATMFEGAPEHVEHVVDRVIPSRGGDLPIRVYRHAGPPRPVFLYLHGGGWTLGDLDTHDAVCRRIARAADCTVISVAYRLGPEHRVQEQLDDVVTAFRWVATHGSELGSDATRLALGGDSAGGHLTAAASLRLRDEGGPSPAVQVLIYPATQPWFDTLSYHENGEGYFLTRADCIWFWGNLLGPSGGQHVRYAVPMAEPDLSGLPPAVVITAEFDPLRDDGEMYAVRLKKAGVPVIARRFPGMIHGFVALPIAIPAGDRAIALISRAIRRAWDRIDTP